MNTVIFFVSCIPNPDNEARSSFSFSNYYHVIK